MLAARAARGAAPTETCIQVTCSRHGLDTCEAAHAARADTGCGTLRGRATVHCSETPVISITVCLLCSETASGGRAAGQRLQQAVGEVRITKAVSMDRQSGQIMAQLRKYSLAHSVAPSNPNVVKGCTYMHIHTQSHLGRSFKLVPGTSCKVCTPSLYTLLAPDPPADSFLYALL